jgi:hypothetical protein
LSDDVLVGAANGLSRLRFKRHSVVLAAGVMRTDDALKSLSSVHLLRDRVATRCHDVII